MQRHRLNTTHKMKVSNNSKRKQWILDTCNYLLRANSSNNNHDDDDNNDKCIEYEEYLQNDSQNDVTIDQFLNNNETATISTRCSRKSSILVATIQEQRRDGGLGVCQFSVSSDVMSVNNKNKVVFVRTGDDSITVIKIPGNCNGNNNLEKIYSVVESLVFSVQEEVEDYLHGNCTETTQGSPIIMKNFQQISHVLKDNQIDKQTSNQVKGIIEYLNTLMKVAARVGRSNSLIGRLKDTQNLAQQLFDGVRKAEQYLNDCQNMNIRNTDNMMVSYRHLLEEVFRLFVEGGTVEYLLLNLYMLNEDTIELVFDENRMFETLGIASDTLMHVLRSCSPDRSMLLLMNLSDVIGVVKHFHFVVLGFTKSLKNLSTVDFVALQSHPWTKGVYRNEFLDDLITRFERLLEILLFLEDAKRFDDNNEAAMSISSLQSQLFDFIPEAFKNLQNLSNEDFCNKLDYILSKTDKIQIVLGGIIQSEAKALYNAPITLLKYLSQYSNLVNGLYDVVPELSMTKRYLEDKLNLNIQNIDEEIDSFELNNDESSVLQLILQCHKYKANLKELLKASSLISVSHEICVNIDDLAMKCDQIGHTIFQSWVDRCLSVLKDDDMETRVKLVSLNCGALEVSMDLKDFFSLRDADFLLELGYDNIPFTIMDSLENVRKWYKSYESLVQVVKAMNGILLNAADLYGYKELIMSTFKKICIEKHNEITFSKILYGSFTSFDLFLKTLIKTHKSLNRKFEEIRTYDDKVSHIILKFCNHTTEMESDFLANKKDLQNCYEGIKSFTGVIDCKLWLQHWNSQLYKVMVASFQILCTSGLKSRAMTVNLEFDDNYDVVLTPSVSHVRSRLYEFLNNSLRIICNILGHFSEDLLKLFCQSTRIVLSNSYKNIEESLYQVQYKVATLSNFCIVFKLGDPVEKELGGLESFEKVMPMLENNSVYIDSLKGKSSSQCGIVEIHFENIYEALSHQLVRTRQSMLNRLEKIVTDSTNFLTDYIEEARYILNQYSHDLSKSSLDAIIELQEMTLKLEMMQRQSITTKKMATLLLNTSSHLDEDKTIELLYSRSSEIADESIWKELRVMIHQSTDARVEKKEEVTLLMGCATKNIQANAAHLTNSMQNLWDKLLQRGAHFEDFDTLLQNQEKLSQQALALKAEWEKLSSISLQYSIQISPEATELVEKFLSNFSGIKMSTLLVDYSQESKELGKHLWSHGVSNIKAVEQFVSVWMTKLKECEHSERAREFIQDQISHLNKALPAMKLCLGRDFRDDHWVEIIQGILKLPGSVNSSNLTVGHFLSSYKIMSIPSTYSFLKELLLRIQGETKIREALAELKGWSQNCRFVFSEHESTPLIDNFSLLISELEDKECIIQSMKASLYYDSFQDIGASFENNVTTVTSHLHQLEKVQKLWLHLKPIHLSESLPIDPTVFLEADEQFSKCMRKINTSDKIFALTKADISNSISGLPEVMDKLIQYEKSVFRYLDEKRTSLPRLFFIADNDLIEMLGRSSDLSVLHKHMPKIFPGVHRIVTNEQKNIITSFESEFGERLVISDQIPIEGSVEQWLSTFISVHRNTIREAILSSEFQSGSKDILSQPGQIVSTCERVKFTKAVEEKLKNHKSLQENIDLLLEEIRTFANGTTPQCHLEELRKKSFLLQLIHHRDILEELVRDNIRSTSCWSWMKQLRYYTSHTEELNVIMMSSTFEYSFEYQGNTIPLVKTPLTNRCFLSLSLGLQYGYGGNPYGPAGTGKTETVKDLGTSLARHVVVFNCDEGLDYFAMGRMLTGLSLSGAWGCFDEFNRLKADQLSAISEQIAVIQYALRFKNDVVLLSREITVHPHTAVFVTLNPVSEQYKGRSTLPENLKDLFRPVLMSKPDSEKIAEVELVLEGFSNASALAKKLVCIFNLASKLIRPSKQYNWGLRSIKAVLRSASRLFYENKTAGGKWTEELIIGKAICLCIIPTISLNDLCIFNGIVLAALQIKLDAMHILESDSLSSLVNDVTSGAPFFFANDDTYIKEKVVQLMAALGESNGCIMSGDSFTGKSSIWSILKTVLHRQKRSVRVFVFNPRSMSRKKLFGYICRQTNEWKDGVLTNIVRTAAGHNDSVWIICDGVIDPDWIETMNSVFDDNKVLTLTNGERIVVPTSVNFIFETSTLAHASPATISRMRVINLNPESILSQEGKLIAKWLKAISKNLPIEYLSWVGNILPKLVHIGIKYITFPYPFAAIYKNIIELITWVDLLPSYIGYACQLLSASMDPINRPAFLEETRNALNINLESDIKVKDMNELWIERGVPLLLCGPPSCGKEVTVIKSRKHTPNDLTVVFHCSNHTSVEDIVNFISCHTTTKLTASGLLVMPKVNSGRLVIFVKALNVAPLDKYGTSEIIEFFHQILSHGTFYNGDLNLVTLKEDKFSFIFSATGASSNTMNHIPTRFRSLLRVSVFGNLRLELLQKICCEKLTQSTVKLDKLLASIVKLFTSLNNRLTKRGVEVLRTEHLLSIFQSLELYECDKAYPIENYIFNSIQRYFRDFVDEAEKSRFDSAFFGLQEDLGYVRNKDEYYVSVQQKNNKKLQRVNAEKCSEIVEDLKRTIEYQKDVCLSTPVTSFYLKRFMSLDFAFTSSCKFLTLVSDDKMLQNDLLQISSLHHGLTFYEAPLEFDFNSTQFSDFIKNLLKVSVLDNTEIALLIDNSLLAYPYVTEIITDILLVQVEGKLLTYSEYDVLLASLRNEYTNSDSLLSRLVKDRIKENLSLVCSFNERASLESFFCSNPHLCKHSMIIHFDAYTKNDFEELFDAHINTMDGQNEYVAQESLKELAVSTHTKFNVSSQIFLRFLDAWNGISQSLFTRLEKRLSTLKTGLFSIENAANAVDNVKTNLLRKQGLIKVAQENADKAMISITEAVTQAESLKKELDVIKFDLKAKTDNAEDQKSTIENQLSSIEPLLDEARKSVGAISSSHLSEIKSFKTPPAPISDVLAAVLMLLGQKDLSWKSMKAFLGSKGVKQEILNLNVMNVSDKRLRSVENFVTSKKSSFDTQSIKKVSAAAAPLAMWVKACLDFASVLSRVNPLKEELNQTEASLEESSEKLRYCELDQLAVNTKVEGLKSEFSVKTSEVERLKKELLLVETRSDRSMQLMSLLSDERERWKQSVTQLNGQKLVMHYNALFSSATVTYLSTNDQESRNIHFSQWSKFLGEGTYEFSSFMGDEEERRRWKQGGLPTDDFSFENALITKTLISSKSIVILDPSNRVKSWLPTFLKDEQRGFSFVENVKDSKIENEVQLAAKLGKVLIISGEVDIKPYFLPLIQRRKSKSGVSAACQIGHKLIEISDSFRLIFLTRASTLQLIPSIKDSLPVVNFAFSKAGLEESFLVQTMEIISPELENEKMELFKSEESSWSELNQKEKFVLSVLNENPSTMVENEVLIGSLKCVKMESMHVQNVLNQINDNIAKIQVKRDEYRRFCSVASNIYFVLLNFRKVNSLYCYDLRVLSNVFLETMKGLKEGKVTDRTWQTYFINKVAALVSQCMNKEDLGLLLLMIYKEIYPDNISSAEWQFLMKSRDIISDTSVEKSFPVWIPSEKKSAVSKLCKDTPELWSAINEEDWSSWLKSSDEELFPCHGLSKFQRLLMVYIFKPSILFQAIFDLFAPSDSSVTKFQYSRSFSIKEAQESQEKVIMLICSPGADQSRSIENFALINSITLKMISLGSNQYTYALEALRQTHSRAGWLVLKNLHLVAGWSLTLEIEIRRYREFMHKDFHLWILTEPNQDISPGLLELSLKFALETSSKVIENVHQNIELIDKNKDEKQNPNKIDVILAYLHAFLRVRTKFSSQGWTVPYQFSSTDLLTSIIFRKSLQSNSLNLDYYGKVVAEAVYGGKIDNFFDKRILSSYVDHLFAEDVLNGHEKVWDDIYISDLTLMACRSNTAESGIFPALGLPANINLTMDLNISEMIVEKLRFLDENSQSGDLEPTKAIAKVIAIWTNIRESVKKNRSLASKDECLFPELLSDFFKKEFDFGIYLIDLIDKDILPLKELFNKAATSREKISDIISGRSPSEWKIQWEGPSDLYMYMKGVTKRILSLQDIMMSRSKNGAISMNFSKLFNPISFVNVFKLHSAQLCQCNVTEMEMIGCLESENLTTPLNSFILEGISLQGASFNGVRLDSISENSGTLQPCSRIRIGFVPRDNASSIYEDADLITVPLYTSISRQELIGPVKLPCKKGEERKWILAAVALIVSDDDDESELTA